MRCGRAGFGPRKGTGRPARPGSFTVSLTNLMPLTGRGQDAALRESLISGAVGVRAATRLHIPRLSRRSAVGRSTAPVPMFVKSCARAAVAPAKTLRYLLEWASVSCANSDQVP